MGAGRDLTARRKDGSEFPVEVGLSQLETDQGMMVLTAIVDMSARRQLERTRAYHAAIVESSANPIIAMDLSGVVSGWNNSAESMFGYAAEEIIGRTITILSPADRQDEEKRFIERISQGDRVELVETIRRRKDGTEFPVSLTISPVFGPGGEVIGASKIVHDISSRLRSEQERKRIEEVLWRSEDRFRSIFSAVGEGIFIVSPDTGAFTEVNEPGCAMFGYAPGELIGSDVETISSGVPPYTRREAAGWIEKAAATGVPQRLEWHCKTKDGRLFWAEISIRFASISGQDAVLTIVRDVTERLAVEAQLRQAQKMEAIGSLTGGMAHDFNNLLGVIIGNLDLVTPLAGPLGEAGELVQDAIDAALRGTELTRRLLAFARKQPLRPKRVEINELVSDVVHLLQRTLGENIEITLDLADDLWPVVVDPAQLEAALTNLATNARDAMSGGGKLLIATGNRHLDAGYSATHADVAPGDYAAIEVTDSGCGMAEEIIEHIFEPFFTTKHNGKGTGLGLSMVFGFFKQSGGHISVYSEPNVGTTFRLYLPRASPEHQEVEKPAHNTAPPSRGETVSSADDNPGLRTLVMRQLAELASVGAASRLFLPPATPEHHEEGKLEQSTAPPGPGETVLAVEDNPRLRRLVMRQLAELGYRAIGADGAAAALTILERQKIDVLFTDIVMPGPLDGIGLAKLTLKRWPWVKIVLNSGFPGADLGDQLGERCNAVNFLAKPYRIEELAQALRGVLGP